ncbi:MAG: ABC transporter permease [Planctomycetaceae bacterium]
MFTGSLAMLHRALRLDARLVRTHAFRFTFAGVIYLCLLYAQITILSFGAPGLRFFELLALLNLGLITLAGISFFATAISEEKEEETLSLLKMAGINPLGILLGKSTSRLVAALLLLLVQFPFTLLAITLGGVTLRQVIAAYCSLAAYLVLLANVGLLASVVCRRGGIASATTTLVLVVYFLIGPALAAAHGGLLASGAVAAGGSLDRFLSALADVGNAMSVYERITEIMRTGVSGNVVGVQVVGNIALAAVAFGVAWAGFDFFTRDWRLSDRRSFRAAPTALGRKGAVRRHRPGHNALAWKEFHFNTGGWRIFVGKFVLYGAIVLAILYVGGRYLAAPMPELGQSAAGTMALVLVVESAIYASRIFHDEWRDHTLPLLLMLPVRTPRIVFSKIVGCVPALAPTLVWLIGACMLWPEGRSEALLALVLPSRWFAILVVLLLLTLTAFFSLVVKWGALPLAIGVMLLGSTFGGCCFSPVMAILSSISGAGGTQSWEGAFLCVDIVVAMLIAGLQFDIHRRLEIVGAQ